MEHKVLLLQSAMALVAGLPNYARQGRFYLRRRDHGTTPDDVSGVSAVQIVELLAGGL